MREGPEPPRVFLLERLHAVREADEFLVRRRAVERRLDLRLPLSVLPEQRPPVAVATAMDEVQGEDGEEVAGGAVGRRASHLRGASRRGCSDLGGSRAAAGEERAARVRRRRRGREGRARASWRRGRRARAESRRGARWPSSGRSFSMRTTTTAIPSAARSPRARRRRRAGPSSRGKPDARTCDALSPTASRRRRVRDAAVLRRVGQSGGAAGVGVTS